MTRADETALVIPAYNAAATIADVVGGLREWTGLEIIVVDDGSTDGTARQARRSGARVVAHPSNLGYSQAIRTGLEAIGDGVRQVVTFDADGAHRPEDVPPILERHIARDALLTIGSRFLDPLVPMPDAKRAANYFARDLLNCALGTMLSDVASGLRVLARPLIERLLVDPRAVGFQLPYAQIELALDLGEAPEEYPIRVHYPHDELPCTRQGELLDLLRYVGPKLVDRMAHDAAARRMDALIDRIARFDPARVDGDTVSYHLHPLKSYGAYVFCVGDRAPGAATVSLPTRPRAPKRGAAEGLHVALVPDGSRRWAARAGVSLDEAYQRAMSHLGVLVDRLFSAGADTVSVFLCSRDNLRRPSRQVEAFLSAEAGFCRHQVPLLARRHELRPVVVGDLERLPQEHRAAFRMGQAGRGAHEAAHRPDPDQGAPTTASPRRLFLCVAYDGRWEVERASLAGGSPFDHLSVRPDVDLFIRTGGAPVLSGFLPLQSRHARLYFSGRLFNDFSVDDLDRCLSHYAQAWLRRGD